MSSDEEDDVGAPEKGMSKSLALRVQKKMLGMTLKSKDAAKHMIDDDSGALLDTLHALALKYSGDIKVAKKMIKDLVKISVKLGLLYKHNQFSKSELVLGEKFRKKFKTTALTMISYHDVAFTFDAEYLAESFAACKELLQSQIAKHLTAKSSQRVENVFAFYSQADLMSKLYTDKDYKELLEQLNDGMNILITKL
eukprot:m.335217 g.335217  ORF g.335217 m.335217 type:complete len:196 (-) comp17538_c0_seq1:88-675(-)